MQKRRGKRWIKWLVLLIVLAVIIFFAWPTIRGYIPGLSGSVSDEIQGSSNQLGDAGAGNVAVATLGEVQSRVYGSGNITPKESKTVYAQVGGTVEQIKVEAGDTVKANEELAVLDSDTLDDEINTLEQELLTQQTALAGMRDSGGASTIYAPSSGRLKIITAQKEDGVETIMKEYGHLAVISRDGKMRVEFESENIGALKVGDKVSVAIGDKTEEGIVDSVSDVGGKTVVLISDDTYDVDAEATVSLEDGTRIGSGRLKINMPVPVTGVGGTISKIYKSQNTKVDSGASLFYLKGRIPSADFKSQLLTYEQAESKLREAYENREKLTVRAPIDGVITEVNLNEGGAAEANALAFSMESVSSFELIASVDELDIAGVEVGQKAEVEIDAFADQTFEATVARISALGTVSGGVATYDVSFLLKDAPGVLSGMTASAEIIVDENANALLVPLEAISTQDGEDFVNVVENGDVVRKNVVTGISDDTNIEIVEGLKEGDQVLATRSSSSDSFMGMPNMGAMMEMGGGNRNARSRNDGQPPGQR